MSLVDATPDDGLQTRTWRDVILLRLSRAPTAADVRALALSFVEHARSFPRGVGLIIELGAHMTQPERAAREELFASFDRFGSRLAALAYVIHLEGFTAAAARTAIAATHLLRRRSYAQHTTATLADALRWMLPKLAGGAARAEEFEAALRTLDAPRP